MAKPITCCCCVPVHLGVIIWATFGTILGGLYASGGIAQLVQANAVGELDGIDISFSVLAIILWFIWCILSLWGIYCTTRPTKSFRHIRIYALSLAVHWLVDLLTSLAYITVANKTSARDAVDTCLETSSVEHPEIKDPRKWCNASTTIVLATLVGAFVASKTLGGYAVWTVWRYKRELQGKAGSYGVRYVQLEDSRNAPRVVIE